MSHQSKLTQPFTDGGLVRATGPEQAKETGPAPLLVRLARALACQIVRTEDLGGAAHDLTMRLGGPWPVDPPPLTPEYDGGHATGELAGLVERLELANVRLGQALDRLGDLV